MEKLEKLYRTATAPKTFPTRRNKSDHACASLWAGGACTIEQCPPPCESVKCQQHRQAQRYAADAGDAARQQRHDQDGGQHADPERAEASCEECGAEWLAVALDQTVDKAIQPATVSAQKPGSNRL